MEGNPLPETNSSPLKIVIHFPFWRYSYLVRYHPLVSGRTFFWTTWKNPWGFWFRCWHPEKGHPLWLPFEPGFKLKPCRRGPKLWGFSGCSDCCWAFCPKMWSTSSPEVLKSKIGFRRTESWLQASPPPSIPPTKKPLKHGRIPKTWGASRPNKERGIFYERHCGDAHFSVDDWVFSWSREISVWCPNLSGNGSMDASRPWGTSHPLFFGWWVFCCFKKIPPAGHTQWSDRRAIGAKGTELLMNFQHFGGCRCQ